MNVVSLIYISMFICLVVGILSARYAARKVKAVEIKRPDLIRVYKNS